MCAQFKTSCLVATKIIFINFILKNQKETKMKNVLPFMIGEDFQAFGI